MENLADIDVPVQVVIAERPIPLEEILEIRPGALIELRKRHDAPLDLHVNGALVGRGRAVDIGERGERFGFLLEEMGPRRKAPPPSRTPGLSGS
jgi:flagellar motor switch/type III secretory pathway protein FliN